MPKPGEVEEEVDPLEAIRGDNGGTQFSEQEIDESLLEDEEEVDPNVVVVDDEAESEEEKPEDGDEEEVEADPMALLLGEEEKTKLPAATKPDPMSELAGNVKELVQTLRGGTTQADPLESIQVKAKEIVEQRQSLISEAETLKLRRAKAVANEDVEEVRLIDNQMKVVTQKYGAVDKEAKETARSLERIQYDNEREAYVAGFTRAIHSAMPKIRGNKSVEIVVREMCRTGDIEKLRNALTDGNTQEIAKGIRAHAQVYGISLQAPVKPGPRKAIPSSIEAGGGGGGTGGADALGTASRRAATAPLFQYKGSEVRVLRDMGYTDKQIIASTVEGHHLVNDKRYQRRAKK